MKSIILAMLICLFSGLVSAQKKPTHLDSLYRKYPLVKSSLCRTCVLWVNPYFRVIADTQLRQSKITYAVYSKAKEDLVVKLNLDRTGPNAAWHPYPGFPNEDKFYIDINKTLVKPDVYAKGHYAGWILQAYARDGVLLSDTYDLNEGIERQAQNVGTELQIENLTRALVGSGSSEVKKVKYKGPIFDSVQYWKGSWGSTKIFKLDGITKNYSAVYWDLIKYGSNLHAYWFPNDLTGTEKAGFQKFEIEPGELYRRLGFNPMEILNDR